ncbi:MAG: transcriptional regulator [Candidatus Competibacteraceae bacterium]|nr:transcriptional regulator [Candidatus Competibacteraceae bacterium]
MYTVIETHIFRRMPEILWSEEERMAFTVWITAHPLAGVVVPKSGGCRKVRWHRANKGKRGGVRVIDFNRLECGEIWLLVIYAKAVRSNIPVHLLKAIKEAIENE